MRVRVGKKRVKRRIAKVWRIVKRVNRLKK
jgi:hypothetical protein